MCLTFLENVLFTNTLPYLFKKHIFLKKSITTNDCRLKIHIYMYTGVVILYFHRMIYLLNYNNCLLLEQIKLKVLSFLISRSKRCCPCIVADRTVRICITICTPSLVSCVLADAQTILDYLHTDGFTRKRPDGTDSTFSVLHSRTRISVHNWQINQC